MTRIGTLAPMKNSRRTFLNQAARSAAGLALLPRALGASGQTHASGTTYYIDAAGSNRNSGTSASEPWADFVNINSRTFAPGDSILLRRGCVWRGQFTLNGAGIPGRFLTVSAYGVGPRPHIQRTGNQSDRCMRLNHPSYVKVSSMEVSSGGVGIVLFYNRSYNNRSVYLDDIVAHDFTVVGAAREDPHDRVSWPYGIGVTGVDDPANDQTRVLSDLRITNTEVYNTGGGIALDWGNHTCVDGITALSDKFGDVFMEHLHLHDNTVDGVSFASLFLSSVTGCTIRNSLIDKGARYAPTGTAAAQVMFSRNVALKNIVISNTPFNACPDNSGIDFECDNENVTVDGCTFQNNAGPAIEILATPNYPNAYTRNLVITNCSFIGNNWAHKLGSNFQIAVPDWQRGNTPTGRIEHNTYRNAPGTAFFGGSGNTTQIALSRNTERPA
jgi:hypothetical protein